MEKDIDIIEGESLSVDKMKVVDLYAEGLELNAFAYHKTSIEAIQQLAETGKLPFASVFPGHFEYKRGDDPEIWDQPEHIKSGKLPKNMSLSDGSAKYFAILKELPFEPTDKEAFYKFCDDAEDDCLQQESGSNQEPNPFVVEALKHGVTQLELRALFNKTMPRKGIVIGLSKDIERDFGPDALDGENAPCRYIDLEDGLPIKYIKGIEPMGTYELSVLNDMQDKVEAALELQVQETPPQDDPAVGRKILSIREGVTLHFGSWV